MRKIVIHKAGDYRELKLENCSDLIPGPNECLIEVKASGVNYADIIIRWGLYESAKKFVGWPITPGFEFSGVIKSVPTGETGFKQGDAVFGVTLFNAYADQICVESSQIYLIPSGMSYEEAAGLPAVFMTAYHALFQNVIVRKGMTALIHSAAGGVGSALVQLCRNAGIRSIGVVGASHKVEFLKELGCDHIIDKSIEDLWAKVKEYAPLGVDLAFDANGVSTLKKSYEHLAPSGKLVAYGAHSMFPKTGGKVNWPKLIKDYIRTPRFNPLSMTSHNKSLITFNLSFLFNRKDLLQEAMSELMELYEQGKIRAPAITTYPLDQVASAHKDLESGNTIGKLVLVT